MSRKRTRARETRMGGPELGRSRGVPQLHLVEQLGHVAALSRNHVHKFVLHSENRVPAAQRAPVRERRQDGRGRQ